MRIIEQVQKGETSQLYNTEHMWARPGVAWEGGLFAISRSIINPCRLGDFKAVVAPFHKHATWSSPVTASQSIQPSIPTHQNNNKQSLHMNRYTRYLNATTVFFNITKRTYGIRALCPLHICKQIGLIDLPILNKMTALVMLIPCNAHMLVSVIRPAL